MGMELAIIAVAATAVSTGFEMVSNSSAASAQLQALQLEGQQETIRYQQKSLENLNNVTQVLDAQVAESTTRGYAVHSASFNAIQRKTVNTGAKQQSNLDISHQLSQESLKAERSNVRRTLTAKVFGGLTRLGSSGAGFITKLPELARKD